MDIELRSARQFFATTFREHKKIHTFAQNKPLLTLSADYYFHFDQLMHEMSQIHSEDPEQLLCWFLDSPAGIGQLVNSFDRCRESVKSFLCNHGMIFAADAAAQVPNLKQLRKIAPELNPDEFNIVEETNAKKLFDDLKYIKEMNKYPTITVSYNDESESNKSYFGHYVPLGHSSTHVRPINVKSDAINMISICSSKIKYGNNINKTTRNQMYKFGFLTLKFDEALGIYSEYS